MSVVSCPACQKKFKLTDRISGRRVRCQCGNEFQMPAMVKAAPTPTAAPVLPSTSEVRFQCPSCQRIHKVAATNAGKVSSCPCGTKLRVPSSSAAPPAAPPSAAPPTTNLFEPMAPSASPLGAPPPADPNQDLFGGGDELFANDGIFSASSSQVDPLTGAAPGSYPAPPYNPPKKKRKKKKKRLAEQVDDDGSPLENIMGGCAAMLIAVVWFVGGLFFGILFYFPPVLFVAGLLGVIVGIFRSVSSG